jgi:hypothetical protein
MASPLFFVFGGCRVISVKFTFFALKMINPSGKKEDLMHEITSHH